MSFLRSLLLWAALLVPAVAWGQSASEVERCFQNPAACAQGGGGAGVAPPGGGAGNRGASGGPVAARPATPAPDYTTVLQSPDPDRRKLQESLRTLDKYNGPIDGNLSSDATVKAIEDWQRGRGTNPVGKLTPLEAQQLNLEAARAPIRRVDPLSQAAAPAPAVPSPPAARSNADQLKDLQARLVERRKAAEPKAEAAAQALVRDLKSYVAADGKGPAGEQFAGFAKWYADTRAAGRAVGEIAPAIDDYGEAKAGAAVTSEVLLETRQGGSKQSQCLVFAWVEGAPRRNAQVFSCDDVAGVEKWKTDQALRSAWR